MSERPLQSNGAPLSCLAKTSDCRIGPRFSVLFFFGNVYFVGFRLCEANFGSGTGNWVEGTLLRNPRFASHVFTRCGGCTLFFFFFLVILFFPFWFLVNPSRLPHSPSEFSLYSSTFGHSVICEWPGLALPPSILPGLSPPIHPQIEVINRVIVEVLERTGRANAILRVLDQ